MRWGSLQMGIITPETRFSTRFFSIWTDGDGNIIREDVRWISSITSEQAGEYAQEAMERGNERGWVSDYRYKTVSIEHGNLIVFVNGSMNREVMRQFLMIALPVLVGSGIVILLLIIFLSKFTVRPVAESYEKQKQFITDANHELKTPLTLIRSNLDIVESEFGKSEWLDDIRSEGERMGALVNQLVTLTRMDEDHSNLSISSFDLAAVISDTVSEFQPLAEECGKKLQFTGAPPILYNGDEGLIRRLISILLDNAVKYCDSDGMIWVTVSAKRNPVLTVENTYKEVDMVELDRLFNRFYRADKARSYTENFEPVSTEINIDTSTERDGYGMMDGMGGVGGMGGIGGMGGMNRFGTSADFTIVGYSSDAAMTSFVAGTASISEGSVFEAGTANYDCIISEELAIFNDLSVGDTIKVANPKNEEETYELNIVGLYTDSSANISNFSMFPMTGMTANDPANRIYMSYTALQSIINASESVSEIVVDENTGMESESALTGTLSGTYVFADADAYHQFEEDVRTLGLDESYAVSSTDLASYENSLTPLNTLSTMAGWFLVVILLIGAVILVVLNIFNTRERKYEIGVLTAMGMKKGKVAMQFITETFVVTMIAVLIGVGVGAVSSVPVTNALLENQVASQQEQRASVNENFGRGQNGMMGGNRFGGTNNAFFNLFGGTPETNYVTEISSAMNFTVVLQMFGIAILLVLVSGMVSVMFVMRYEPLKILANRD